MAQTQVTPIPSGNLEEVALRTARDTIDPRASKIDVSVPTAAAYGSLATAATQGGLDAGAVLGGFGLRTVGDHARKIASLSAAQMGAFMTAEQLPTGRVTRRPGTAASGALSMKTFLDAGQIFVSTQRASQPQVLGRVGIDRPSRGHDEAVHKRPGPLFTLMFKPVGEPIIQQNIEGVTPAMKSALNQAEATVVAPPLTRHPRSSSQGPQLAMMPSPSAPA